MAELKDMTVEQLIFRIVELILSEQSAGEVTMEILSRFKEQQDKYEALTDECTGLKRRIVNLVKFAAK